MKKLILKTFFFFLFLIPVQVFAGVLGETAVFNIEATHDLQKRNQVSAEITLISGNAEFFVDQNYLLSLGSQRQSFENNLKALADEFDNNIYPKLTDFFGKEWSPGIDNNPRISMLLIEMVPLTGGYFRTQDEFPKTQAPESNERELIYLNTLNIEKNNAKSFLAHEFQHLISFNQLEKRLQKNDDVWANELRSEYVSTILNYDDPFATSILKQRLEDFKQNPADSLTEWKNELSDYGSVSLFSYYLADQYGAAILSDLLKSDSIGIEAIEAILKSKNISDTFSDIFINWSLANFFNNTLNNPAWGYKYPSLAGKFNIPATMSFNQYPLLVRLSLKDWQPELIKFEKGWPPTASNLKLEFERPDFDGLFEIAYLTFEENGAAVFNKFEMRGKNESIFVKDFGGKIKSVLVLPLSEKKKTKFSENEPVSNLTIKVDFAKSIQPIISEVFPNSGLFRGGVSVGVKGENFSPDMKIYLFSQKTKKYKLIKKFNFIDSREIKFKTPRWQAGVYDLVLATPGGEIVSQKSAFTYFKK
ncbi:MAG: IPT/TIG domain-containing protein [Parcubacteria group bacterium]|nr:IPT/TIG domain-containing protein [Parcubacteria group bacterium]